MTVLGGTRCSPTRPMPRCRPGPEQSPVPLLDFVAADGTVGDIATPVMAGALSGQREQQRVLGADGVVRVLSAFQLADDGCCRSSGARRRRCGRSPPTGRAQRNRSAWRPVGTDHPLAMWLCPGLVRLPQLAQLGPQPSAAGLHHPGRPRGRESRVAARHGVAAHLARGRGATAARPQQLQLTVLFGHGEHQNRVQGRRRRRIAVAHDFIGPGLGHPGEIRDLFSAWISQPLVLRPAEGRQFHRGEPGMDVLVARARTCSATNDRNGTVPARAISIRRSQGQFTRRPRS